MIKYTDNYIVMHMKNVIFALPLLLVGCSSYNEMEDVAYTRTAVPQVNLHVDCLIEKARYGDGKAYLELANCYREGKGVEKDLMNTILMAALAERYNGVNDVKSYFLNLPENNEYRTIFKLLDNPFYYEANQVDSIFKVETELKASDL